MMPSERLLRLRDLPGLKEDDLKGPCVLCSKPFIRSDYPPLFYRLFVERYCVDLKAVGRRHGLAMMLGSDPLARVMGPNEDLAKRMDGPATVFICEPCFLENIPEVFEAMSDEADQSRGDSSTESAGVPTGDAVSNPHPAPPKSETP